VWWYLDVLEVNLDVLQLILEGVVDLGQVLDSGRFGVVGHLEVVAGKNAE
jgi:hypothetical protein